MSAGSRYTRFSVRYARSRYPRSAVGEFEELIATSGALTLLTNCVMAWNTQRLQRALDREGQHVSPRHLIDALSHIGPVGHKHISFRGIYRFPVEQYSARLVASAA